MQNKRLIRRTGQKRVQSNDHRAAKTPEVSMQPGPPWSLAHACVHRLDPSMMEPVWETQKGAHFLSTWAF